MQLVVLLLVSAPPAPVIEACTPSFEAHLPKNAAEKLRFIMIMDQNTVAI